MTKDDLIRDMEPKVDTAMAQILSKNRLAAEYVSVQDIAAGWVLTMLELVKRGVLTKEQMHETVRLAGENVADFAMARRDREQKVPRQ